jgi:hypothetical protein
MGKSYQNGEKFPKMGKSSRKWNKISENGEKFRKWIKSSRKLKKVPEIEETKLNLYQRQMPQHKVLFRRGAALKFSLR